MWARWHSTGSLVRRVLWGVPIVITFRDCCYCPVFVEGRSMQPALGVGGKKEVVIVEKWSVLLYRYERGGVYLLRSPENPKKFLVKRLLALEGDWITVPGEVDIHKIPVGHCWIEGDNIEHSTDSRTAYGPVPVSLIEGRVAHIIWPISRGGRLQRYSPSDRLLITNSKAFERSRPNP